MFEVCVLHFSIIIFLIILKQEFLFSLFTLCAFFSAFIILKYNFLRQALAYTTWKMCTVNNIVEKRGAVVYQFFSTMTKTIFDSVRLVLNQSTLYLHCGDTGQMATPINPTGFLSN